MEQNDPTQPIHYCRNCGHPLDDSWHMCQNCGFTNPSYAQATVNPAPLVRTTAYDEGAFHPLLITAIPLTLFVPIAPIVIGIVYLASFSSSAPNPTSKRQNTILSWVLIICAVIILIGSVITSVSDLNTSSQ